MSVLRRLIRAGFQYSCLRRISNNCHCGAKVIQIRQYSNNATKLSFFLENKLRSMMGDDVSDDIAENKEPEDQPDSLLKETIHKYNIPYTHKYYNKVRSIEDVHFFPDQEFIQAVINPGVFSLDNNNNRIPNTGSLVEVFDPSKGEVNFGVVLEPKKRKFKIEKSLITVFTIDGSIEEVKSEHIRFHIYEFFKAADVKLIKDSNFHKNNIQFALISFLEYTIAVHDKLRNLFEIGYSKFAKQHELNGLNLALLLKSFPHKAIPNSILKEQAILFALHMETTNDPVHWVIVNNNNTNNQFSPSLTNVTYLSNSVSNSASIKEFLRSDFQERIEGYRDLLKTLLTGEAFKDLDLYLAIIDTTNTHLIDVMKFYIIYPHPIIHEQLVLVLEPFVPHVTPKSVFQLLVKTKIYNNNTDVFLSSKAIGEPKYSKQSVIVLNEIKYYEAEVDYDLEDRFAHIRNESGYQDYRVYALPSSLLENLGLDHLSELALSIDKINSRKYFLNIHIPDIASKLSPYGELYHYMMQKSNSISLTNGSFALFEKDVLEQTCFRSTTQNDRIDCVTYSVLYQPYEKNPWKTPEFKVRFETVGKIKKLTTKQLDEVLNSRNEILPINLFENRADELLGKEDKETLKHIYSMIESSFWNRCSNSALVSSLHKSEVKLTEKKGSEDFADIKLEQVRSVLKSTFLAREAQLLVGDLTAKFGRIKHLPLIHTKQDIIEDYDVEEGAIVDEEDDVFVTPANVFLPKYHATTYDHLTLGKDKYGQNSPTAFICGINFLTSEQSSVSPGPHVRHGLTHGLVDTFSVMRSLEAVVNQYQLLYHFHSRLFKKISSTDFSRIHDQGYLKEPLSVTELQDKLEQVIMPSKIFRDAFVMNHKKYWVLRWLHADMNQKKETSLFSFFSPNKETNEVNDRFPEIELCDNKTVYIFKCIVTENGSLRNLGKAYCMELGIEVEVLLSKDIDICVGDRIVCTKVLFLDPNSGRLVLML